MDGGEILALAEKGNLIADRILQQTARILADAITNLSVVLNPSLVVLGGRVGSRPALFKATSRIIECNEFCRPRLAVSTLAAEASVMGAVHLALSVAEKKILPEVETIGTLVSPEHTHRQHSPR